MRNGNCRWRMRHLAAALLLVSIPLSVNAGNEQKAFVEYASDALRAMNSDRSMSVSRCSLVGIHVLSDNAVITRMSAGESPLRLGDKIRSINGVRVTGSAQVRKELIDVAPTGIVLVGINRDSRDSELAVPCEDSLPRYSSTKRVFESISKKRFAECLANVQEVYRLVGNSSFLMNMNLNCQIFAGRVANATTMAGLVYERERLSIEEARWDSEVFRITKGQVLGNLSYFQSAGYPQYARELQAQLDAAENSLSRKPDTLPGSSPAQSVSSGSGFFVNDTGRVMTSAHVVSGAKKIMVHTRDGSAVEARVIASSDATDLAILDTSLLATPFLSLAPPRTASVGMPVFTYGFPVAKLLGSEPKFTDGTVSALSGIQGEQTFLQISVPVQPGNSGGPLVNDKAQVIGVIAAQAAIEPFLRGTGTLPQNVNWAVKAEYGALLAAFPPPQPDTKGRQEAIQRVQQAICYVEASN